MSAPRRAVAATRSARVESWAQLVLMLGVGVTAACASWSHVLSLANGHGQRGWLAWAVAACVETAAVSAGLEVRRRRRSGQSTRLPLGVLGVATVLQLAAQVAEAERSVWGVVLAAVPAVTFLVLVKLAMSRGGDVVTAGAVTAPAHGAGSRSSSPSPDAPPAARTAAPSATPRPTVPRQPLAPLADAVAAAEPPRSGPEIGDLLLPGQAIAAELERAGEKLTRARLIEELRDRGHSVSTGRATALLAALKAA